MRSLSALLLVAFVAACKPPVPEDDDPAPDTDTSDTPAVGAVAITLRIDDDWGQAVLDDGESLVGDFWGDLFLADDVSGIGPDDGAEPLASLNFTDIDLSSFEATGVVETVTDLPAGYITALGFFDSDGNADPASPGPDAGDPVTLPNENEFEVIAGETTTVEIFFGFRNP